RLRTVGFRAIGEPLSIELTICVRPILVASTGSAALKCSRSIVTPISLAASVDESVCVGVPLAAERVDGSLDSHRRRTRHSGCSAALLDDVRQLVSQQSLPDALMRRVPALRKDQILSNCIGQRANHLCGRRSVGPNMHPHGAEIMAEARLEEGARRCVKGLPA